MPSTYYKDCVIIGGSRGLGAALTGQFLDRGDFNVRSISKSSPKEVKGYARFLTSGRYSYYQSDITSDDCNVALEEIVTGLGSDPVCIIFNAAKVATDIRDDMTIDLDAFTEINSVGINGFGRIIKAFEPHLLKYGGVVVAVSSFSALEPPVREARLAYPASKAFLDMAMRALRFAWHERDVKFVTVHLGHLGNERDSLFCRNYKTAAALIVDKITGSRIPDEINYPFIYSLIYRTANKFIPDPLFFRLLNFILGRGQKEKK